jgi:hypothetical protein
VAEGVARAGSRITNAAEGDSPGPVGDAARSAAALLERQPATCAIDLPLSGNVARDHVALVRP